MKELNVNKDLILLQKNGKSTAAIVLNDEFRQLKKSVIMKAGVSDKFLFATPLGHPPFAEHINKNIKEDVSYFVITDIDKVSKNMQERFVGLVKDREFHGYNLPQNVIIVFTVESPANVKNIIPDLYHFCVVAF